MTKEQVREKLPKKDVRLIAQITGYSYHAVYRTIVQGVLNSPGVWEAAADYIETMEDLRKKHYRTGIRPGRRSNPRADDDHTKDL